MRFVEKGNARGSLKWIRQAVNVTPQLPLPRRRTSTADAIGSPHNDMSKGSIGEIPGVAPSTTNKWIK